MKLGKELEMDKPAMVLQPSAEKRSNHFKVAFFVLLGVLLVSAVAIISVYIGGKLSRDAYKEASESFTFRTKDGQTINETITVTDDEEDIALGDGSHIIYDYSKGFMVMKTTEGDRVVCYVANFDRRDTRAPTADQLEEIKQQELSNVTMSDEVDYYVDRSSLVDPSILSERSRDACEGADIYWMSTNKMKDANGRRRKRSWNCTYYCHFGCCWGLRCGVACSYY